LQMALAMPAGALQFVVMEKSKKVGCRVYVGCRVKGVGCRV